MAKKLPRKPLVVSVALLLVVGLICYRVGLLFGLNGLEEFATPHRPSAVLPSFAPVPGRLGNPLLSLLLIPTLVVARRLMGRGYEWAMWTYVGYLALRSSLILVGGPWNLHAAFLLALSGLIVTLLIAPPSRTWFSACAAARLDHG